MLFTHKPDWLYNILPAVYGLSGVFVILSLRNDIAIFSGALLIFSAISIIYLRWSYRRVVKASQYSSHNILPAERDPRDNDALKLVWHREFECSNAEIDDQHRRLFELSNSLIHSILTRQPKTEISFYLDALVHDLSYHFQSEERLLLEAGHPITKPHRKLHAALEARCTKLVDQYKAGEIEASVLIGFLTFDIIGMHIAKEDRLFIGQV
jgi:hemerythrin-like metal-binding protein